MNDVPLARTGRDALLRRVRQALKSDNLPLAEALAHEILRIEPTDSVAWAVLSHIASLIGRKDEAIRWLRMANTDVLSRFDAPVKPRVQEILKGCGPCPDEERFLVIKPLGYDFWSEAFHALGGRR